jgi:rare lipoprotein A
MKLLLLLVSLLLPALAVRGDDPPSSSGQASWYGESHRGRLMANGKPFDPDAMTAASWFYPLGTKVRVTLRDNVSPTATSRSIIVTITDRGPAKGLIRTGRIIDLSRAAFQQLTSTSLGLIQVSVNALP